MHLRTLLLYIGLAVLGFYLLGFVLNLAANILDIVLAIGLILIVSALVNKFYTRRKSTKE